MTGTEVALVIVVPLSMLVGFVLGAFWMAAWAQATRPWEKE